MTARDLFMLTFLAGTGTFAMAEAQAAAPTAAALAQAYATLHGAQFIDLTHEFGPNSPHWKGFAPETVTTLYTIPKDGFHAEQFCHPGQWGTHVDPPAHFHDGLKTVDQIEPSEFLLRLVVLDVHEQVAKNSDYVVALDDVKRWERRHGPIPAGAFVALRTDWSKRWPDDAAMQNLDAARVAHYPGWSKAVLQYLYETRHITASGHETTDTDPGLAVTSAPCPWYPLIDSKGIHLPPGFSNYQTPNVITNAQDEYIGELRWQSTEPVAHFNWTAGVFWQVAKERSIEELKDTQNNSFFEALYGETYEQIVSAGNGYPSAYYSCPGQTPGYVYAAIPQCDIYYNNNVTFDRQIAGYGELSYAFTDQWKLTVGERVAYTTFALEHYADGLENYGPSPASASEHGTPNTPKASLGFQMDQNNLFYVTYSKGFRVGGGNAPLPPYCDSNLQQIGYASGAPLTYRPDSTQNYEVGSKNLVGGFLQLATSVYWIRWSDIQQNVYVGGACGLQFTDNLGTAVAKGFDLQADLAFEAFKLDFSVGYTDARFSENSPHPGLALDGDAISGQEATEYAPGTNPPWTIAIGPQYDFKLADKKAFVRADFTFESRNPWLAAVQDPRSLQCNGPAASPAQAAAGLYCSSVYSYTLPSHSELQMRAGVNLGNWLVAVFCENCLNSHTVLDYQLGQLDPYNPAGSPTPQQNQYTYRPLTVGVSAILHLGGGASASD